MNRTFLRALLFVAALSCSLLLVGCPPPATFLDGSIKTSHDLTFDTFEARFIPDQETYQLTWLRSVDPDTGASGGQDVVARVTFTAPNAKANEPIDLTKAEVAGRVESSERNPFPPDLERGTVTFTREPVVGELVSGEVAATFTNGKTLDGAFEETLAEVSF